MLNRRTLILSAFAAIPAAGLSLQAALAATKDAVFSTKGVAINGYDPVDYFAGGPVKGDAAHQSRWNGAVWHFSTAQNKAAFEADPDRYAPQYGGYCAYAVSQGYTASTDPAAWSVVEGKLYLNYSKRVRRIWERDIPGHIASADANWPSVLSA